MMQKEKIEHKDDLTITPASDKEIIITRSFDASRELVFKAMTDPKHVKQWRGPRASNITVSDADLRVGGTWRVISRAPDGTDHAVNGVIREYRPPERLVRTSSYENVPGMESLETLTFEERDGRTTVTMRVLFKTSQQYNYYLTPAAEHGAREVYERLDEELAKMA